MNVRLSIASGSAGVFREVPLRFHDDVRVVLMLESKLRLMEYVA